MLELEVFRRDGSFVLVERHRKLEMVKVFNQGVESLAECRNEKYLMLFECRDTLIVELIEVAKINESDFGNHAFLTRSRG
jgi:hypothetical protein